MRLDVNGMKVLLVGEFSRVGYDEAVAGLEACGATLIDSLEGAPDFVIAGKETNEICARARDLDIAILTEHALLSLLGKVNKRRKEELFPSSENLALVRDLSGIRRVEVPLPNKLSHHTLKLALVPTTFETTRRFGETWGLRLSEHEIHYLGWFELDGRRLAPSSSEEAEHLYYCRFREDGSNWASGDAKFTGENGFHASWLEAALRAHAPIEVSPGEKDQEERPIVWFEGEGGLWTLKLNAEYEFGHVQAVEHEELVLDFEAGTWRWEHYYCPSDMTY